jgi:predicted Zn-ribbon and HTH transcriptional regulator
MSGIIGEIKDGVVIKGSSGEGFIYKDPIAFSNKEGICYVPELSDTTYSYKQFLDLAGGNEEVAEMIFNKVTWEHPESFLEQAYYLVKCRECGWVYDEDTVPELDTCPKCGTKQYLI